MCFRWIFLSLIVCSCVVQGQQGGVSGGDIELDSRSKISKFIFAQEQEEQPSTDPFTILSEQELQKEWSSESDETLLSKIDKLQQNFEEFVYVDVKLVGFEDDTSFSEVDLARLLNEHPFDKRVHVLKEFDAKHNLFVKRKFFFQVSKASKTLASDISTAIISMKEHNSGISVIPISTVDSIIQADFLAGDLSYTIYVISTKTGMNYSYVHEGNNAQKCWFSCNAGKDRYMWLDLSSTSVEYGPKNVGEGVVTEATFPSLKDQKNLVVDIVSFIQHTCEYLIASSLAHFPIPYRSHLTFHLVLIHYGEPAQFSELWNIISKQLLSISLLPGQTISLTKTEYLMSDCLYCAAAQAHALKTYLTAVAGGNLQGHVRQYLDSKELHHWLQIFQRLLITEAADNEIPIFVFDLPSTQPILLDGFHQAISFPDMVLAVRTQSTPIFIDYTCNKESLMMDLRNITRPILGCSLETAWGIAATHSKWSTVHKKPVDNFLWSTGLTPFGPFSNALDLSFAQRDAAVKHILYSEIHTALDEINLVFNHFKEYGKEVGEVLSQSDHLQFVRRWNMFQFKLDKARKFLSLNNFNSSFAFVKSLHYDVTSLHKLIHSAGQRLYTFLYCEQEEEQKATDYFKLGIVLTPVLLMVFILYVLLQKIAQKKNK